MFKNVLLFSIITSLAQLSVAQDKEKTKVNWYSFEEAIAMQVNEPKKIFVDVYTDWCGWCKVMDKNTFSHDRVAEYLNNNYYPVKLDAEQKEDITIGNKTYKFVPQGNRGYHELAAVLVNGKLSYPTVVFLNEKLTVVGYQPGYRKPKQMDEMIRYYGENAYLDKSYEEFIAEYTSPIKESDK